MSNQVKNIFVLIVVLVLVSGVLFFFLKKDNTRLATQQAYQFEGNFVSSVGNTITVSGVYTSGDKAVDPLAEPKEVKIEVTNKTVIERESFKVPDTTGVFYPDKLPKETTIVYISKISEDALSNPIGLIAIADSDIFNKDKFVASKITYRVPVFSTPR